MKRIAFYGITIIQAIVLIGLALQYYLIDPYGQTIAVEVDLSKNDFINYEIYTPIYMTYEINEISQTNWHIAEDISYNDIVYVLLEEDADGIYRVKEATTKKVDPSEKQILLKGQYEYDYL